MRWVNRGAVDLLGANPGATESAVGLMKAKTLYGSLTDQLDDPESFVSQIKRIVAARKEYGLAEAEVVDVPDVSSDGVAVLVMKLPDSRAAVTVLNYGREQTTVKVALPDGVSGGARDIVSDGDAGTVFGGELSVDVGGLSGRTLVLGEASSKSSGSGSGGGPGSGGGS